MTQYTFDENVISDLYKDARGYRPTIYWWEQWKLCTDDQKQVMWDNLCDEHEAEMKREAQFKAAALTEFEERLHHTIRLGANGVKGAIKWIIEAEEFSDFDLQYGADYFCYHFGLDFSVKNDYPIQEAMNEMLAIVA